MTLHQVVLLSLLMATGGPLVNSGDTETALTNMADMDSALTNMADTDSALTDMADMDSALTDMADMDSALTNMADMDSALTNMAVWDISKLSGRFLVDVTYEQQDSGAKVVVMRTVAPSSNADKRKPFPRDNVSIIISGTEGVIVFSSTIHWRETGELTSRGEATYSARILVHPTTKHLILSDTQSASETGGSLVGEVSFDSLFD